MLGASAQALKYVLVIMIVSGLFQIWGKISAQ